MANVFVIGSGSWGTAISVSLARGGHSVALWSRNVEFTKELCEKGENARYLPGVKIPSTVEFTRISSCRAGFH